MQVRWLEVVTVLSLLAAPVRAENIVFPADAGIVNVRTQYGARGDEEHDDTAAIQQAINDHPNQDAIIYLPNGTYRISDTLRWSRGPRPGSEEKNIILQGQSRDGTLLKLKDHCPGFTDPSHPKAMIWTGEKPAQRFRNAIRNLTLETGRGNPGAIGMQFMANNQGGVRDVTIRSGDGQGPIGLDLAYTDENGPLLIENVRVIGFDIGIKTATAVDSETLEDITLEHQNRVGLRNEGQCVSIHGLTSRNAVPAVENAAGPGLLTLVNATLRGQDRPPSLRGVPDARGRAANQPAIRNQGALFAREIRAPGYARAILNTGGDGRSPEGRTVREFVSHPILSLFPSPPHSLRLPIRKTPAVPWDDPATWASPTQNGAQPDDGKDATRAIQGAIDSGKSTVYLPRGRFEISDTIHVRGKVRRIIGCEANLEVIPPLSRQSRPVFRFEDGASPVVVVERMSTSFASGPFYFLEHAASRALLLSSVSINFQGARAYRNTGTGPLFIEDVVGGDWVFRQQPVWARQFNVENEGTHVVNDGGQLWILGLKTERGGTLIETRHGGQTELLGGFCYTTTAGRLAPMFTNEESSVSFTIGESWFNRADSPYTVLVRETRRGQTRTLKQGEAPGRTGGSLLPLYVGYSESP